jgi:hypothetical protein
MLAPLLWRNPMQDLATSRQTLLQLPFVAYSTMQSSFDFSQGRVVSVMNSLQSPRKQVEIPQRRALQPVGASGSPEQKDRRSACSNSAWIGRQIPLRLLRQQRLHRLCPDRRCLRKQTSNQEVSQ